MQCHYNFFFFPLLSPCNWGDSFHIEELSAALFTSFASTDILSSTADRDQINTIRIFSPSSIILPMVATWLLSLLHCTLPMTMTLLKAKTPPDFKLGNSQCFSMGSWWWSWEELLTTKGITIARYFLNLHLPWESTCSKIFVLSHLSTTAAVVVLTL